LRHGRQNPRHAAEGVESKDGNFGLFYLDEEPICKTVEKRWHNNQQQISCIPLGVYHYRKRFSEKYGWHWHIYDVPGRDLILIHNANWAHQLLGCIGVGDGFAVMKDDKTGITARGVTNSRATMDNLRGLLPDEGEIEISQAA